MPAFVPISRNSFTTRVNSRITRNEVGNNEVGDNRNKIYYKIKYVELDL